VEWAVNLECLRGQGHAIPDPAEYMQAVVEFFVHEEAAGRLLILDIDGETDEMLWRKLSDFALPAACRADMSGIPFPGSGASQRPASLGVSGMASPMDGELLLGKMKEVNSIISVQLMKASQTANTYDKLTMDELKKVHTLMARDLSEHSAALLDQGATVRLAEGESVFEVLARRCFIAQPVALNSAEWLRSAHMGCIRVALSAPHVSDLYEDLCKERTDTSQMDPEHLEAAIAEKVFTLLHEDKVVLEKLTLILTHWKSFVQ
jgi:hypothetical protein